MKEFLNEFKSLEKLCSEIYGEAYGISRYIDDMTNTPSYTAGKIPGWDRDLANLKRVRYIRNLMVHNADYSDDDYEQEDVEFIRLFHQRILDRQDPIALRRQLMEARAKVQPKVKTPKVSVSDVPNNYTDEPYYSDFIYDIDNDAKNSRNGSLKRIAIGSIILTIIVLWILIKVY